MTPSSDDPESSASVAACSVAVFAHRESVAVLRDSLAAIAAAEPRGATVDLLVNGNAPLASELSQWLDTRAAAPGLDLRVWSIALGDKAHAWNQYVHGIWPGRGHAFNLDGYVRVREDSLQRLLLSLRSHPDALAATGVPTVGRSAPRLAAEMQAHGGLHGNLFVLRQEAMYRLRTLRMRLPLGLYRTDATLGAWLAMNLEPSGAWQLKEHVIVTAQATWEVTAAPWWYPGEIKGQYRRRIRQARGTLENMAVRHFWRDRQLPAAQWPTTIAELVASWAAQRPDELRAALRQHPLALFARNQLIRPRNWDLAAQPPIQVWPPTLAVVA